MRLLIIDHTFRPLASTIHDIAILVICPIFRPIAFTIHEIGMASSVPNFIASCYRAANPT